MFAVAFEGSVGVWSTARAEEICTFSSRNIGRAKEVMFAGEEGTELVLVGQEGTVCWDLLTLEGKPTLLVDLEVALNSLRSIQFHRDFLLFGRLFHCYPYRIHFLFDLTRCRKLGLSLEHDPFDPSPRIVFRRFDLDSHSSLLDLSISRSSLYFHLLRTFPRRR